jgi:ribosomal protein L28
MTAKIQKKVGKTKRLWKINAIRQKLTWYKNPQKQLLEEIVLESKLSVNYN